MCVCVRVCVNEITLEPFEILSVFLLEQDKLGSVIENGCISFR